MLDFLSSLKDTEAAGSVTSCLEKDALLNPESKRLVCESTVIQSCVPRNWLIDQPWRSGEITNTFKWDAIAAVSLHIPVSPPNSLPSPSRSVPIGPAFNYYLHRGPGKTINYRFTRSCVKKAWETLCLGRRLIMQSLFFFLLCWPLVWWCSVWCRTAQQEIHQSMCTVICSLPGTAVEQRRGLWSMSAPSQHFLHLANRTQYGSLTRTSWNQAAIHLILFVWWH